MSKYVESIRLYLSRQASGTFRYLLEQTLFALAGWIPSIVGILVRGILYRLILRMDGWAAIDSGVRLRFANLIRLGNGVYLDHGTYLHACPKGITIGRGSIVMHGAILHVYNFRNLPSAGITIGEDCLISEYSMIRGQGGVVLGNRVYTSPYTQIVAVNHVFDDPKKSFVDQGITAEGITIKDDVWLGAGAIVCDGVTIGEGAVVAAGAVVTEDVPPRTLIAGVPAKAVRNIGNSEQRSNPLRRIYY